MSCFFDSRCICLSRIVLELRRENEIVQNKNWLLWQRLLRNEIYENQGSDRSSTAECWNRMKIRPVEVEIIGWQIVKKEILRYRSKTYGYLVAVLWLPGGQKGYKWKEFLTKIVQLLFLCCPSFGLQWHYVYGLSVRLWICECITWWRHMLTTVPSTSSTALVISLTSRVIMVVVFSTAATSVWNSLPEVICSSAPLALFRKLLKT